MLVSIEPRDEYIPGVDVSLTGSMLFKIRELRVFVFIYYVGLGKYLLLGTLHTRLGFCAVTATRIDVLTLFRRRAYTSTTAGIGCTAARGLALVVLEHKHVIGTNFSCGSSQRFIRRCVSPGTGVTCREFQTIELTHGAVRIFCTCRSCRVIRKFLFINLVCHMCRKPFGCRSKCRGINRNHKYISND